MGERSHGGLLRQVRGRARGRVLGASGVFGVSEFGGWVVLLLYGYAHDGTTGATVMVLVQLVPGLALSPYAGSLAGRLPPARVLAAFSGLSPPVLESVARRLEEHRVVAGTAVVREGEPGDRYFAVADGTMSVTQRGRTLHTLSRGSGFGEIALLARSFAPTGVARSVIGLQAG